MKRKVIKQGNGTLTITLPKQWTEKIGLKGGDEINLEETERGILINSEKILKSKKIKIDATNFNERVTRLTLSAAHKAGFDEIEIIYENPSIIKIMNELVKELYMGFSIVEQTNKRCVLKAIASDKVEDFDTILRRAFLVALSMADSSLDMIKNNQFSDLPSLVPLEHFNNQLTNFCERVLNKKGYRDGNCFYYVVAWNLEKVCDNYKYICDHFSESKGNVNKKILDFYKQVNVFFRNYYEIFYKFDINELVKLTQNGKELLNESFKMHKFVKNDFEFVVLNSLMAVVLQCLDFSASYIAINEFK
jgi:phosphate uptake regulator